MTTLRQTNFGFFSVLFLYFQVCGCLLPESHAADLAQSSQDFLVYFGTYTGAKSKGIYVSRFSEVTGELTKPDLAAETTSPSFLALAPNNKVLYAVNEVSEFSGKKTGAVSAFTIDESTGTLKPLNRQPSGGAGPCYVSVDRSGKAVLVANYGSGSIETLPVESDGRLGEPAVFIQHHGSSVNPQRQEGPHAHFITTDARNRFALVCDLGLDEVLVYKFNPTTAALIPNVPPSARLAPGSGPRHLAFHPNGRFAYVISEIKCTMTAFTYDADHGELKELQTLSTLPDGETVKPNYSTAEVVVHPSGKFLYGSNRGHNSIVVYAIDRRSGRLAYIENVSTQGKTPRNFAIDPTGAHLLAANQDSDNVVEFGIDSQTGRLTGTGQNVEVGSPVCVQFVAVK